MNAAQPLNPTIAFDKAHAADYDQRFAKLAAIRDALHLLTGAVLADLPQSARILCVGAGTGAELLYLARKFPHWQFTAVEPSAPMLDVCRRRVAEEQGIGDRCTFHEGYLDTLPPTEPFHAATSLFVSQFVLVREDRIRFFRAISDRLSSGGTLVSADLSAGSNPDTFSDLMELWLRVVKEADFTAEKLEQLRAAYRKDVAILPVQEVRDIIVDGGFTAPMQILQAGLIHGWSAQKA